MDKELVNPTRKAQCPILLASKLPNRKPSHFLSHPGASNFY
jgi:hypothetical protein